MIGRIQEKNVSVPQEETFPTETITPGNTRFVEDPDYRKTSSGIASVQDGFENAQEDDLLEKLGLGKKGIADPVGYPGEEWLWQES